MSTITPSADDAVDEAADEMIAACLDPASPQSFFLFAGAGSGKTRSLVEALRSVQAKRGTLMRRMGQRVGVITYTNAACDEINRRLLFNPLFDVRTIHSFAWSLIEGLDKDIRTWVDTYLRSELEELRRLEANGRQGKASDERKVRIERYTRRLELLPGISRFVYSPTGTNQTKDSLNHSEVLQLASHFLSTKPRMQSIFVGRYPILLVDESQDTNRHLVDALFEVDARKSESFTLGLIGDMMQRIYADGKEDLGHDLPKTWAKPAKAMNHRCPVRIVKLLNEVRGAVDEHKQRPRSDATEGVVRLFITRAGHSNTFEFEDEAARTMAEISDDPLWTSDGEVKTLTLEHRMAARRLGCQDMFSALYQLDSQALLSGSMAVATFFTEQLLPIVEAKRSDDRFALMRILRLSSPLLSSDALRASPGRALLATADRAVDDLYSLFAGGDDPILQDVLRKVAELKLLEIPDRLLAWCGPAGDGRNQRTDDKEETEAARQQIATMGQLLASPFSQTAPLRDYLAKRTRFDTHQGVKGLEFDRVMVIMDDHEARGFAFKYEDLFGKKAEGKTLEATRRLFYVVASRAQKSLALIAYTDEPARVREFALRSGWFAENEVVVR